MELSEAFERVVLRHWVLIVICGLLVCVVGGLYEAHQPAEYRAGARFLLDASDPTSEAGSQALADTAKGLATAPTTVADALAAIGAVRDPVAVAKRVSVVPLGSSGVLLLTATDADPTVAKQLANRLTQSVIQTRGKIQSGGVQEVIAGITSDIAELTKSIDTTQASIDDYNRLIAAKNDPGSVASLEAKISSLRTKQNLMISTRDAQTSERTTLLANSALKPQASIIDLASVAVPVNGFALPAALALALVLGLFIGVTVAAVKETFGPTVGGRAALAREAGAPYLGSLPAPPWRNDASAVKVAASHVRLAAIAAGVDRVELIGADPNIDLVPLTREMTAALGERARTGPEIGVIDSNDDVAPLTPRAKTARRRTALVLVTPAVVRRSAFQAVGDYRSLAGLDLIGVVDYRRYRWTKDSKRTDPFPPKERSSLEQPVKPKTQPDQTEEEAVNS